jgi:BirA family biotin operon repressor/biotin-[acetyl-CoA-carboxylase] ligase
VNRHKRCLTPAVVEPLLRGRFGHPYLWVESCGSTQDVLRDTSLPEGAVATTEHQTAGRGRAGRTWDDAPGAALLVSVLLRPPATAAVAQLSLVCALAAAETVEGAIGRAAAVKWPNDVLVDRRKVAGILLEGRDGSVACGVGLNANQEEASLPRDARTPVAALRTHTGREHDRAALLVTLLERLELRYDAWLRSGLAPLLPGLERRHALRGSVVTVGGVAGTAEGIASDGRLRVRSPDGTSTLVASGEVAGVRLQSDI